MNAPFVEVWLMPDRSWGLGTSLGTFWKDPSAAQALIERLHREDAPVMGEMQGLRLDGVPFGCRYTAAPVRDPGGQLLGYLLTFPGAPLPAGGGAAGRQGAKERRGTMENLPDGYVWVDARGRIIRTNPSAARMFGYDAVEDLLGRPVSVLYAGARDRLRLLEEVESRGSVRDWLIPCRRRDGSGFVASVDFHQVQDEQGRTVGTEGFIRDATARIQAEEAHNASMRRMIRLYDALNLVNQAILKAADRATLLTQVCKVLVENGGFAMAWIGWDDPETRVVRVGASYGDITDYLGQITVRSDDTPEGRGPTGRALRTGEPQVLGNYRDPDFRPWLAQATRAGFRCSGGFPIRTQGRVTGVLMVHACEEDFFGPEERVLLEEAAGDVSYALDHLELEDQQRRADAERQRMEKELQHLQRLESLGQLAGGVSHDMNNVLATIMGIASIMELRWQGQPDLLGDVQAILNAAGRGRDLVRGLRDFSRKELDSPRLLDLNELVRTEGDLLERTTVKKIAVELDLEEGLPLVYGEAGAIANAILNLGVNARDAMPTGGRLVLATHSLASGYVELAARDDGEGMAPEVLARALEPFYTTKPAGKGTGLGLSQVYGTMKAHGGSLHIESRPGAGTRVSLIFPPAARAAESLEAAPELPPDRSPLNVLLVDDEPLLVQTVASMLRELGHAVETAAHGLECLEKVEAGLAADLVILDNIMPVMDGVETLGRIRDLRPRLPVLITTGSADERVPALLERFSGVRLLSKPFSIRELREALAAWPPD